MPPRVPRFDVNGAFYGDPVTLASTTATAAGSSGAQVMPEFHTLRLTLAVTAVSGTSPSATVTVQTSADGSTWVSLGAFAARGTVGSERKVFPGVDRFVRCSWTVSGTSPSVTFSVAGEAL